MTRSDQSTRISVVISTRNRPIELGRCLQSVVRAKSVDDEIIVVDSASTDASATRDVVARHGATLLRLESAGSARARNAGIRHSAGKIIAFTDDDAVVDEAWLEALADRFADPIVSAVVGPVFELGGEPQRLLCPTVGFDAASERASFSRSVPEWFSKLRAGHAGFGTNLAVRRSVFDQYEFFRECLGAGAPISGDENYFLLVLIDDGGVVVNEPRAWVYHPRQTDDRIRELRNCRLAYLLFVFFARPRLRLPLIFSSLRTVRQRRRKPVAAAVPSSGIFRELISTPKLLMRAFQIDRADSVRRSTR